MSHFTHVETRFQNLFYLEKALTRLHVSYTSHQESVNEQFDSKNLVISQLNGYDIQFFWNGKEYDLIVDLSFWEQPYSVQSFIDKIAQHYAGEVIIGESCKTGFEPVNYQENYDGSNTIILERWNKMV